MLDDLRMTKNTKTVSAQVRHSARRGASTARPIDALTGWPRRLHDDPAVDVCMDCEHFGRLNFVATCRLMNITCSASVVFFQAVTARACPLKKLDHLKTTSEGAH
jgi:hypothetical protein